MVSDQTSFEWNAPASGDVEFRALCGDYYTLRKTPTFTVRFSGKQATTTSEMTTSTIPTTKTSTVTSSTSGTSSTQTPTTSTKTKTTTTKTGTTVTSVTTTTIFDPDGADCVESQDECTDACQTATQRNYVLNSSSVRNGRPCRGL
jgi:hypothetical protein